MLIVKKFGGTSVANKERIYNVANRCVEEYKKGNDVVVVLSAMGKYTDELITMAEDINEKQPFMQMHVRSIQMWMVFILLIRERCRMHAN